MRSTRTTIVLESIKETTRLPIDVAVDARRGDVVSAPPRSAYVAWIAVCIIWGTTYLGIRVALEAVPPMLMGGIRWTIAGAMLAAVALARGERLPASALWPSLALQGLLMLGFGNGFVNWAEQHVPSGLAAVTLATSPVLDVGASRRCAATANGSRVARWPA